MKKKNKGKKKVWKIIVVIILMAIVGILSYYGTFYLDKKKNGGEVKVTVTFDDTESYVIPNTKKLDKEKAMEEWPYMMEVENSGDAKGLYQIIITDMESSNITRDKLDYVLMEDEKEIASGNLDKLNKNVLFEGSIEGKTTKKYKLYIWSTEENTEDAVYEYKLEFNTIKAGGPGF